MYYEGKIYRPWMEANSLLIQTTLGCTRNKCTFCDMFREKRFRIRKIEEIFKDIVDAGGLQPVLDEQRFSLEEAGKAHDRLSSGQAMGKVIVDV